MNIRLKLGCSSISPLAGVDAGRRSSRAIVQLELRLSDFPIGTTRLMGSAYELHVVVRPPPWVSDPTTYKWESQPGWWYCRYAIVLVFWGESPMKRYRLSDKLCRLRIQNTSTQLYEFMINGVPEKKVSLISSSWKKTKLHPITLISIKQLKENKIHVIESI